jgi:O-Antigen ligase
MNKKSLGLYYALFVPYAAAIASIGNTPKIITFRYTGWIWVLSLLIGPILVLAKKRRVRFPIIQWGLWYGIAFLSLLWTSNRGMGALQYTGQLITPFVVGITASVFVRSNEDMERFWKGFRRGPVIAVAIYLIVLILPAGLELGTQPRPMAMTMFFFACCYFAGLRTDGKRVLIGWGVCLAISIATESRMATLAIIMIWFVYPHYRRHATKVALIAAIPIIAMSLFYLPMFKDRMFKGEQTGTLQEVRDGKVELQGSGRFEVWPVVFKEAHRKPILGQGIGSSEDFVGSLWEGTSKTHNEYLRILFEQGYMGLIIFITVALAQLVQLRKRFRHLEDGVLRQMYTAAYMALALVLVVAATDNPFGYSVWFMNPLFALIGVCYGMDHHQRREETLGRENPNGSN